MATPDAACGVTPLVGVAMAPGNPRAMLRFQELGLPSQTSRQRIVTVLDVPLPATCYTLRMPPIPENLRIDYARGALGEADIAADPIEQFGRWFADAAAAGIPEINAMTLATAEAAGVPSARVVLLKDYDARGFTFFTNYASRKAREIEANPRAALCLYWQPLERQVRIEGTVERTSREESDAYFRTRPPAAQIGAWASHQSSVIPTRAELEERQAALVERFAGQPVPLPDFWGGYRVVPTIIEFWQGRPSRLHDRIRFSRTNSAAAWRIERLSP